MLVISRRPGQKIVFPELGIAVEVVRSQGATVRLGITAPDDVRVLRDEVLSRIAQSEFSANETSTDLGCRRKLISAQRTVGERSSSTGIRLSDVQSTAVS
jgi:carbon storage regulator CsrA